MPLKIIYYLLENNDIASGEVCINCNM